MEWRGKWVGPELSFQAQLRLKPRLGFEAFKVSSSAAARDGQVTSSHSKRSFANKRASIDVIT